MKRWRGKGRTQHRAHRTQVPVALLWLRAVPCHARALTAALLALPRISTGTQQLCPAGALPVLPFVTQKPLFVGLGREMCDLELLWVAGHRR